MSAPTLTAERLQGAALAIAIGAFFAAIWGVNGSIALPGPARIIVLVLVLAITVVWFALANGFRRAAQQSPQPATASVNPFSTRAYRIAVIAECIAIPVAARLLTITGYPDAIMSAVALIVGLHFFGLVPAFRSRIFAVVGGAMALLALLSLAFAPSVSLGTGEPLALRAAVVGLGCAVILWGGLLPIAITTRRYLAQQRA